MINTTSKMPGRLGLLTLTFLFSTIIGFAQGTPNLTGTYEGIVKMGGGPEGKVSLDLKSEGGKITGRAVHGPKAIEISEAKLENGTLTIQFAKDHMFVGKVDGDKLVGEVSDGPQKFPIELMKVTPATAAAPAAASAAPAAVDLDGQWDAIADANGQGFPFLLVLKIEGDKVTGSSS